MIQANWTNPQNTVEAEDTIHNIRNILTFLQDTMTFNSDTRELSAAGQRGLSLILGIVSSATENAYMVMFDEVRHLKGEIKITDNEVAA